MTAEAAWDYAIGIIHEFGKSGFNEKNINKYLRQLVRLTEIAVRRE